MAVRPGSLVTTADELAALYPAPSPRSLAKESDVITPRCAELIGAAPFVVVASHGHKGVDWSPRAGARSRAHAAAYDETLDEYIAATLYEGPAKP